MVLQEAPNSITERLREGLARVGMVMRIDEWNRSKASGLNPTQLAILTLLEGRGEGGLSVHEIAAHLGVSQPTATDSINALERKTYVEKQQVASDRRATRVVPTAAGLAALAASGTGDSLVAKALAALDERAQEDLLLTLVTMIRYLQVAEKIPVQRMCVTCRHFSPFAHADAVRPHHCRFVDAAFGQSELRIDCRDHVEANPAIRAAAWDAFQAG